MFTHRVFVSHTKEDQEAASRVCALLEADGIRCWLASRDAISGEDEAAATIGAIRDADLVLLIFSASANTSPYVLREIERAIAYERPVLSIHLDSAVPNPSLEYYLNLWQWLEAPEGVEERRGAIVAAVRRQLAGTTQRGQPLEGDRVVPPEAAEESEVSRPQEATSQRRQRRKTWVVALMCAALIVALGLGLGLGLQRQGSTWTELLPTGGLPEARERLGVAYESSKDSMIMFGGINSTSIFDDTWAYDPVANRWTDLDPPGTVPSKRYGHSMAYDPNTHRVILFGGLDDQAARSDTWAYDPIANRWNELNPPGATPSPRGAAVMVYDPITRRMVLFGGVYWRSTSSEEVRLNDTWAYDPVANTWTELKPSGEVPSARAAYAMTYDNSKGLLILFGGNDPNDLGETWGYDPAVNKWTELKPSGTLPPARMSSSMAYDSGRGRAIMYGGWPGTGGVLLDDTWEYDSNTNSWTEIKPVGEIPGARRSPSLVYCESARRVVMLGGATQTAAINDTWAYTR